MRASHIKISRKSKNSLTNTVKFNVGWQTIWFQSDDVKLAPKALALACPFVLPALETKKTIIVANNFARTEHTNLQKIARQTNAWWGYNDQLTIKKPIFQKAKDFPTQRRTGLCFSCGADSFDVLLRNLDQIDDLILVHGFDVSLDDELRFNTLKSHAEAVAVATGKRLICIKTNLRRSKVFCSISWEISHGAALAAIGHLLNSEIDRLIISASYPQTNLQPWGSSPLLDPFWSDDKLKIDHLGADLRRSTKLRQHGSHPLIQEHLAICWSGRGEQMNCGHCEKCVRSQLALLSGGITKIPVTFPQNPDFADQIYQMKPLRKFFIEIYEDFLQDLLPTELVAPLKDLIKRSKDACA